MFAVMANPAILKHVGRKCSDVEVFYPCLLLEIAKNRNDQTKLNLFYSFIHLTHLLQEKYALVKLMCDFVGKFHVSFQANDFFLSHPMFRNLHELIFQFFVWFSVLAQRQ